MLTKTVLKKTLNVKHTAINNVSFDPDDSIPLDPEDKTDVGQGLDYQNLFSVCNGNTRWHLKGTRKPSLESLTCDKHRGTLCFHV